MPTLQEVEAEMARRQAASMPAEAPTSSDPAMTMDRFFADPENRKRIQSSIFKDVSGAGEQLLQGATGNQADEITDPAIAGIGSLLTGTPYAESYKKAREISQARLRSEAEDHPILSTAANLAGILKTGGLLAETGPGAAIADKLRAGLLPEATGLLGKTANLGTKMVLGGATGAASGAVYNSGAAPDGQKLDAAKEGALFGGGIGAALPVVAPAVGAVTGGTVRGAKNLAAGMGARDIEGLDSALEALRSAKNDAYQAVDDAGAIFKPAAIQGIVGKVEAALAQSGPSNPKLHGQALAAMDDLRALAKKPDVTLTELEQHRQILGQIASNFSNKTDAYKAGVLKSALDDSLSSLSDKAFQAAGPDAVAALTNARAANATYRKSEIVMDVIKRADGDANKIKRGLFALQNNKKKMYGFSDEEKQSILDAARNNTAEGLLKIAGKFGFDIGKSNIGSGVGAVVGGAAGAAAAGASGAAIVPAVGTAARSAQKYLARGKAENVLRMIEEGGNGAPPGVSAPGGPGLIPPIVGGSAADMQPKPGVAPEAAPALMAPARAPYTLDQIEQELRRRQNLGPQSSIAPPALGGGAVAPPLLDRIAAAESGGNPNAKSPDSTASGLFQFTTPTWNRLVNRYGKQAGITKDMKADPEAQRVMAGHLAQEHAAPLAAALGRPPTDGELYVAHFAGLDSAKRLLAARGKQVPAFQLFSRNAVNANRSIFYDGRRARSANEVLTLLENKV